VEKVIIMTNKHEKVFIGVCFWQAWMEVVKQRNLSVTESHGRKQLFALLFPVIACRTEGETPEWKATGVTCRAVTKAETHQLFGFSGESSASIVDGSRHNHHPDRLRSKFDRH
jgi:hypothetical protein